ncbi:MAG: B12-binding domain-containing radical SAM protein, partial [Candidatus Omnitrophica bacterium]|nr:B12-binding domain-containing radical SAM protein [Candidatus Omnitrophota bacterium]
MKNILIVNPWIYDFAAYDLWMKPWGLLKISSILKRNGFGVDLIDCLDRHHPSLP